MNPLDLKSVYKAIRDAYPKGITPPTLPDRDQKEFEGYLQEFSSKIESVPNTAGVYLWFAKTKPTNVEFIYVGEAGRRTKGLQRRFYDEFKNWHHCFWATLFRSDKYLPEAISLYVESGKYKPKRANYTRSICNDWLKRGATHLAYRADLPTGDLKTIQDDLIQLFGNPRGNIAGRRPKPLPENKLLPISKEVYNELVELTKKVVPYVP